MANAQLHGRTEKVFPEQALLAKRSMFFGFLVKRLGSRADAEDVLQEFYVRVLTHKDQIRHVGRAEAWLFAILRSTLNDHLRRKLRRGRLAEKIAAQPEGWEEDAAEQMARMCTCHRGLIDDLRPADAELLRRIELDEEDRAVVAADLKISRNALNVRLHRARAMLRAALDAHCGPCCKTGADDCYCPPNECGSSREETHGGDENHMNGTRSLSFSL